MWVHFRAAKRITNYPLWPVGIGFQLIDEWSDLHLGNVASHPICFTYFGVTTSHNACG